MGAVGFVRRVCCYFLSRLLKIESICQGAVIRIFLRRKSRFQWDRGC